jgi:hypothetical protein
MRRWLLWLCLCVVGPASPVAAARSITITSGSISHFGGTDQWTGSGQVTYDAGDTVLSVQLKKNGALLTTSYSFTGSSSPITWSGWAYPAHATGTFTMGARGVIRPEEGLDIEVDTAGTDDESVTHP